MPLRRLASLPRWLRGALVLLLLVLGLWGLVLPAAAPSLLRWAIGRVEPELAGHRLRFERAEFAPWRLALRVEALRLLPPQGEDALAAVQSLHINVDALGSLRHRAISLDALHWQQPRLQLSLRPEGTNWSALVKALQAAPAAEPGPPPRLRIALLQIEQGRLDYRDASASPVRASHVDALQLELRELSTLPEERGAHQLVARTGVGALLRWRGEFSLQPLQAQGELEGEGLNLARLWALLPRAPLAVQAPAGSARFGLRYAFTAPAGQAPQLQLERMRLQIDDLALQGLRASEPALRLRQLQLEGGRLDLQQRRLRVAALRLQGGQLQAALDAAGQLDLLDWLPPAATAPAPAGARWQIGLDALDLQGLALRVDDAGFAAPQRLTADALQVGLAAELAVGGKEPPQLRLTQLRAQAEALKLGDGAALRQLRLDGGAFDLDARRVELGALNLDGLTLRLQRDAQGTLPLLAALQRRPAPASEGAPWQTQLGPVQVQDASLELDDASVQPAARWQLKDLRATLQGLGGKAPQLATASAQLASGGRLRASGRLAPVDLRLQLDAVQLAPLQPYVAAFTTLSLRDGRLRSDARLRLGKAWQLDGRAQLAALRLDDAAGPFFAWKQLDAPRLRLAPALLDLGSLRVDGLQAQLLIDKQRRVNWAGLLKTPPGDANQARGTEPPPRVTLQRLRLADAQIDFADLSLALPFAARIHKGEGEFAGLDTAPGSAPAQLRFEGQVDEFGSAQAGGTLQPLAPTAFSDIDVTFRNVEMTSLTPYTATFAGRRIASGKLDLDLEYKLRERQLRGDNRVVMTRLILGEKVNSPDASSLPLDLAIALLEDSEGRIELGLPVSGSLDDPQFSYGGLIWKVVVNVLTKVVTSPFRALGSLFGSEQEVAAAIAFAPGRALPPPPEREKLKRLAEALVKRPGLALRLSAGYAPDADAPALKTLQLQRALALEGGDDASDPPRLMNVSEAATAAALERLARQRLGAAAVDALRARHALAQPAPPPSLAQRLVSGAQQLTGTAPKPLSEAERAELGGQPLAALLWQRLLAAEPLAPEALPRLGAARAEALRRELLARGLPEARIRVAEPEALKGGDAAGVKLPLGAEAMPR